MGGSSGGARPKIFYKMDGKEWIVKFPSSYDGKDIGKQEYLYSICAKKCGIEMPETRLLHSELNSGYFAVERFDRQENQKVHMVSVSGILETSHRIPNLDYNILMRLTMKLTEDYEEIEKLYRQMCFNVFAHNRDDHSKNFSYIYKNNRWHLSPAYDLTYSNSIGGEHATTVNGNGRNPQMKDILAVAAQIKLNPKKAKTIATDIQEIVKYAAERYIEVIPEIDLPGHIKSALAAYPELSCDSTQTYKVSPTWGVFEQVFCPSETTFKFFEGVMDEVIEITVQRPGEAPITSNIKVKDSDLELLQSLKDMGN